MIELRAENLAISRGDHVLLRGLSFGVVAGEILHVCGANGTGKTSLLEVLGGLRDPAEGQVTGLPEADDIHWVGHKNALNPALSPAENLRFWCGLQDLPSDRVPEALSRLGLNGTARRPCRMLSAGQKRRTALARLVLARRLLWLLDEPLSALDAEGTQCLLSLLREHAEQGGAAVITSHQPLPELPGLRRLNLP